MKCTFCAGQRVVCIYEGPWFNIDTGELAAVFPEKGTVYEIGDIALNSLFEPSLVLREIPDFWFSSHVFEPVVDISVFTAMLDKAPSPTRELEPA